MRQESRVYEGEVLARVATVALKKQERTRVGQTASECDRQDTVPNTNEGSVK